MSAVALTWVTALAVLSYTAVICIVAALALLASHVLSCCCLGRSLRGLPARTLPGPAAAAGQLWQTHACSTGRGRIGAADREVVRTGVTTQATLKRKLKRGTTSCPVAAAALQGQSGGPCGACLQGLCQSQQQQQQDCCCKHMPDQA
jgi:hypothetical protein